MGRESIEEGDELEGVSERDQEAAWLHLKRPGRSGKQEVAGAASALAMPRLCPSGEGGRRQGGKRRWAGPCWAGWWRQVSGWAAGGLPGKSSALF